MKNKLFYLISGMLAGMALCGIYKKYRDHKKVDSAISPRRFELGFHLFNKWLKLKNEGKSLTTYFIDNEITTVAIYGMGALGERLFEELKESEIVVKYAIDRIAGTKKIEGLNIIGLDEELSEVDAIIVTPIQDFYDIEETLEMKTDADIVSLEDIVDYCI